MRELLLGLVPGLPDAAVRSVVARADGVPLYAVEIVRMLVADGRLSASEGAYRPTGDITDLAVPTSLQALIGARLDALDPVDRQLLQDAAVLGQTFSVTSLAAVSGTGSDVLEGRLRALVRRELLVEENDPRSPERGQFGFVQALIREVAYGTIALADRRARHLAAARHFEALGEDSIAGALAAHYVAAYRSSADGPERDALAAQARLALRGAADRAIQLGSHDHAIGFLRQAIEVTSEEAERAALLQAIGNAATTAGHHQVAIATLREALERFEALDDARGVLATRGYLGSALLSARDPQGARVVLEPVEGMLRAHPDDPAAVRAAAQVPRLLMFLGDDQPRALEVADLVMSAAQRLGMEDVIADTLITKGAITDDVGRRHEGVALLRAGIDLATRLGIPQTAFRGMINIGTRLSPREAFEVARNGHAEAARLGLRSEAALLLGNAASLAVETGDWQWAIRETAAQLEALTEPSDRINLLAVALWFERLQGRSDGNDLLAEFETLLAATGWAEHHVTDRADTLLAGDMASGDFADALRQADLIAGAEALNREYALTWGSRAAALGGLRDPLMRSAAALDALGPSVATARAAAIQAQAGLAAMDGRPTEALAGYREAIRRWHELGCRTPIALCGLEMALRLDHAEPEVRSAIDASRDILVELEARPWLTMLEEALAATPRDPEARAAPRSTSAARVAG
jgi:tetratricopeptide (TPR) repeat protein